MAAERGAALTHAVTVLAWIGSKSRGTCLDSDVMKENKSSK